MCGNMIDQSSQHFQKLFAASQGLWLSLQRKHLEDNKEVTFFLFAVVPTTVRSTSRDIQTSECLTGDGRNVSGNHEHIRQRRKERFHVPGQLRHLLRSCCSDPRVRPTTRRLPFIEVTVSSTGHKKEMVWKDLEFPGHVPALMMTALQELETRLSSTQTVREDNTKQVAAVVVSRVLLGFSSLRMF